MQVLNEIVHRDVAAVELGVWVGDDYYTATGVARRHPEDDSQPEIGLKYAYARALSPIVKKPNRQADGAVKHAEDVKFDQLCKQRLAEYEARVNKLNIGYKRNVF